MIFLLNKEQNILTGHDFQGYTYGPYSFQLTNDLETLESLELIRVHTIPVNNSNKFAGKQFKYELSEKGKIEIEHSLSSNLFSETEKKSVEDIISDWNDKSLSEILDYVYPKYVSSE